MDTILIYRAGQLLQNKQALVQPLLKKPSLSTDDLNNFSSNL